MVSLAGLPGFVSDSRNNYYTCISGSFPTIQYVNPNPPPLQCPSGYRWAIFLAISIHMQTDLHTCAKCVPKQSSCLAYVHMFECVTPLTPFNCTLGLEGLILLASVHCLMNLYTYVKFVARSVQWFWSFPRFMNWWPPNPHATRVSKGYFV